MGVTTLGLAALPRIDNDVAEVLVVGITPRHDDRFRFLFLLPPDPALYGAMKIGGGEFPAILECRAQGNIGRVPKPIKCLLLEANIYEDVLPLVVRKILL